MARGRLALFSSIFRIEYSGYALGLYRDEWVECSALASQCHFSYRRRFGDMEDASLVFGGLAWIDMGIYY